MRSLCDIYVRRKGSDLFPKDQQTRDPTIFKTLLWVSQNVLQLDDCVKRFPSVTLPMDCLHCSFLDICDGILFSPNEHFGNSMIWP